MSILEIKQNSCNIYSDYMDKTKSLVTSFTSALPNTSTTLAFNQTSSIVISIPDTTDTVICKNTTDTLTNKTLTSTTNTIRATQLATNTTDVSLTASNTPTSGYVLTATTVNTASWLPTISSTYYDIYLTTSTNTTSSTLSQLSTLTLTPSQSGTYRVVFDGMFGLSSLLGATVKWCIFVNGVQNTPSLRGTTTGITGGNISAFTQCIITYVSGNVAVYWSTTGGTLTCSTGALQILRIS